MPTVLLQESDETGLIDACGTDRTYTCEKVYEWTDSEFFAIGAEWLLDRPIRILLIIVLAWVVSRVLQRAVVRQGREKGMSGA